MTMKEWVNMLEGIAQNKSVLIPFHLMSDRQINRIITVLDGAKEAAEYFRKVLEAETPTIEGL